MPVSIQNGPVGAGVFAAFRPGNPRNSFRNQRVASDYRRGHVRDFAQRHCPPRIATRSGSRFHRFAAGESTQLDDRKANPADAKNNLQDGPSSRGPKWLVLPFGSELQEGTTRVTFDHVLTQFSRTLRPFPASLRISAKSSTTIGDSPWPRKNFASA